MSVVEASQAIVGVMELFIVVAIVVALDAVLASNRAVAGSTVGHSTSSTPCGASTGRTSTTISPVS